jgi:hypothetical protein
VCKFVCLSALPWPVAECGPAAARSVRKSRKNWITPLTSPLAAAASKCHCRLVPEKVRWKGSNATRTTDTRPPRGKPLHLTALGDIPLH